MLIFLEKYIRYWFVIAEKGGLNMDMQHIKNELIKVITEVENVDFIDFVYKFVMRLKRNWGV